MRRKGDQGGWGSGELMFTEHLLCARHWALCPQVGVTVLIIRMRKMRSASPAVEPRLASRCVWLLVKGFSQGL